MSGNARGSSTAFNLLYRLGQLRPSGKEIRLMLDHKDSPYIRAVRSRRGADGTVPGWDLGEQCSQRCDTHSADSAAQPLWRFPVQVGFLYLRYTCNPRSIWEWFSSYLDDDEVGGERGAAGGVKGELAARLTASAFQCELECVVTISWPCASRHIFYPSPRRSSHPARRALARRLPWACLSGTFSSIRCAGQIV